MSSRKWLFLFLAGVILLSISCGLPKLVWPAQQTATAVASQPTESAIFDLLGSTWHVVYDNPTFGHVEYEIAFNAGGSLYNNHPNESTPDNDFWQQDGYVVTLSFNDGYAMYTGTLSADGTHMEGTASSDSGGDWTWYADRTSP
jgi:hypothetical protein